MSDQHRADAVSPSLTPALSALAARGLFLPRMYSSTPTCTPARSALLTGLSPWYHGMLGYGNVACAPYALELPSAMRARGYAAAAVGKNHYYNPACAQPGGLPPAHGWAAAFLYDGLGDGLPNTTGTQEFDSYDAYFQRVCPGCDPLATGEPLMDWNSWRGAAYAYAEDWHPTAWVGRTASAWLRNHSAAPAPRAPFLLKVSFHRPHSPYDPPARLLNATPASELPPMRVSGTWDAEYSGAPGAPSGCSGSQADAWCGALAPADEVELARRAYLASIKFVDEQVAAIMRTLESTGMADNTWVLWLSDHGDGQGDHNLHRKGFPYEISTNVPGMIVWPPSAAAKLPRGSRLPLLAEVRDILPTLLDLSGARDTPGVVLNGSSWACLVASGDATGAGCGPGGGAWRSEIDLEHSTLFNDTIHWNALTDGSVKYIFRAYFPDEQLFNLTADPYEMTDLASLPAYASVLSTWRGRLAAQWQREGRGPAWVAADGTLMRRVTGTTYGPNFPA